MRRNLLQLVPFVRRPVPLVIVCLLLALGLSALWWFRWVNPQADLATAEVTGVILATNDLHRDLRRLGFSTQGVLREEPRYWVTVWLADGRSFSLRVHDPAREATPLPEPGAGRGAGPAPFRPPVGMPPAAPQRRETPGTPARRSPPDALSGGFVCSAPAIYFVAPTKCPWAAGDAPARV